jgi:hypothetical protein
MAEIINFQQNKREIEWRQLEQMLVEATPPGISDEERESLIDRIKALYEKLSFPDLDISIDMNRFEHFSPKDKDSVILLVHQTCEEVIQRFRPFIGSSLIAIYKMTANLWIKDHSD